MGLGLRKVDRMANTGGLGWDGLAPAGGGGGPSALGGGHPEWIDEYRTLRCLGGTSPMCSYLVESWKRDGRRFVLKRLTKDTLAVKEWFASVVSAVEKLDHPHVLSCDSIADAKVPPYILMPFVEGVPLSEHAKRSRLEAKEVVALIDAIASAVDHAHSLGVVHGDLHPRHIMCDTRGHPWIFGFAEYPLPLGEMAGGDPHHFAPEQFSSDTTLPASDIFALAEIAFLCMVGSYPFANRGISELIEWRRSGFTPSIRERRAGMSRKLDLVLQRGMAMLPEERHPYAGAFAEAFRTALMDL